MTAKNISFCLVGLGEILWDELPTGRRLGGAPANFAYHARCLGGQAAVASCVGDDESGRQILKKLNALNLSCDHIAVDSQHPTSTVSVKLDENGKPSYIIRENVAWDFIPPSSQLMELAAKTNAVCFGSLAQRSDVSRDSIRAFLKATTPDCLRIFDVNLRRPFYSPEVIETSLGLANVLKLSDEELPVVADMLNIKADEPTVLTELAECYYLRLIALSRADKGSLLFSKGQTSSHNGCSIVVADTVGAGDAFTAALAMGMLSGCTLDNINDHANRVASFVCSQTGATPELPDELRQFEKNN